MNEDEIIQKLSGLSGWEYRGQALEKIFKFADFTAAFAFMTAVAPIADKMNHHPDWSNSYNKVTVRLTSHDAGGVSDRDFAFAQEMERLSRPSD